MSQFHLDPDFKKYKFKELKIYASTEWLADNKKKYRQVFDRNDVTYIYAELSVNNKLFDLENWDIAVELKCFELKKNRKRICSINVNRQVSKFDSVFYLREGWGNKREGAFWKAGTYYWEAWVEGTKVATKYFYIEDPGENADNFENPFFQIHSLKLYEGQYDDVNEDDRTYMKEFSNEETRYIYSEIILKNLQVSTNWHCELFIKFYNEARELKGQVMKLQNVKKEEEEIKISAGWGTNVKGSWRVGQYTVEIVFMDRLIAVLPFKIGEEYVEGVSPVQLPNMSANYVLMPDEDLNRSFEEIMFRLDSLIGLTEIKQKVRDHANYIKFLQLRKEKGFEEKDDINVHSVFTGNPGTGKTTVAKMMGSLYKRMGLLTKGHVHEVDRVDLVGEYIGQTAPKVKEAIEKARGGVLFIDEAYSLARTNDDSKDFGREVIEILIKEMSNGPGDLVMIVAGYPKEMKHFIDSNPGLKSRFKLFFDFRDYLPQELNEIAKYACQEMEVNLTTKAGERIKDIIIDKFRNRDRSFGNARFVFDLIEKAKINLGLRTMKFENPKQLGKEELEIIILEDVEKIKIDQKKPLPNIPIDEKLLIQSMAELNALIGIDDVKKSILEFVEIIRYHKVNNKDVLNKYFLHTVFIGNPGTGKTTVARILTKIYKALGVLERGHIVETDRQGLVAGFVGQTAIKTTERIDEAMGGVLFIDEAYALSNFNGLQGDYGNEAIQTLLKQMEDNRGQFFIFVAGYPDNMDKFLKANPGLSSRFDQVLKFNDYNPQELYIIAKKMINDQGYHLSEDVDRVLEGHMTYLYERRDKYFGNARMVRNFVSEVIKKQNLRLSKTQDDEVLNHIVLQDIEMVIQDASATTFEKKRIGFKKEG